MNAYPTTTTSNDFNDFGYDYSIAKADAIDARIDERLAELETEKPKFAMDTIESALESIALNPSINERFNRWLLQVWQNRNALPGTTGRMLRDYAVSIIADMMNDAIIEVVVDEVRKEY